ncbi:contractile injection system protein, VgrG/Pvc8 family [Janthinobacterium agaricidamnosum]|uniref:contractile injection system protein, VgrG/Pvc8 family n=1 Tax=Janthinobacterium agaricidamnosum TaxID=55508 RepID=UPI0024129939|nr:contractile injection system protein, VgrG/Pvc8 family [Janthinobacterium agaricidamnosum]
MSRGFEFTVELLSDKTTLELKQLQGKLLSVELVRQDGRTAGRQDGRLRYFSGFCFSFRLKKTDGACGCGRMRNRMRYRLKGSANASLD